jgi:hypothetical protein
MAKAELGALMSDGGNGVFPAAQVVATNKRKGG